MVAMTLPPNVDGSGAGVSFLYQRPKPVQSAVKPVLRIAATRGKNERPNGVAPARTISGLEFDQPYQFSDIGLSDWWRKPGRQ